MNEKVKKFFVFEGLMLLVFGVFWGVCMFLPLFLSGSLENKERFLLNMFIMCGPYAAYMSLRCLFLLGKSLVWAYSVSNVSFTSEMERRLAEEWLIFNLFFSLWAVIMGYPLYNMGMRADWTNSSFLAAVILLPYCGYLVYRLMSFIFDLASRLIAVVTKSK
jgi:hypothetical protein